MLCVMRKCYFKIIACSSQDQFVSLNTFPLSEQCNIHEWLSIKHVEALVRQRILRLSKWFHDNKVNADRADSSSISIFDDTKVIFEFSIFLNIQSFFQELRLSRVPLIIWRQFDTLLSFCRLKYYQRLTVLDLKSSLIKYSFASIWTCDNNNSSTYLFFNCSINNVFIFSQTQTDSKYSNLSTTD